MTAFANNTFFEVETCCNCHMQFAMPAEYQKARRNDRKTFHCPAGHPQHYTGLSEEQKLRDELERQRQQTDAAKARAATAEADRQRATKAHNKMRQRVANGVCPCCNRTFQNLLNHMRSEHPEFTAKQTLQTLRTTFGMSQGDIAREIGVKNFHVSLYEREKGVPEYAKRAIDGWVESHAARDEALKEITP